MPNPPTPLRAPSIGGSIADGWETTNLRSSQPSETKRIINKSVHDV